MSNNDNELLENTSASTSAEKHQVENNINLSDILHSSCSRWFSNQRETNTCRDPFSIQDGRIQTDLSLQSNNEKRQFCPICDDTSDMESGDSETNSSR
jgi:hypothetical protein